MTSPEKREAYEFQREVIYNFTASCRRERKSHPRCGSSSGKRAQPEFLTLDQGRERRKPMDSALTFRPGEEGGREGKGKEECAQRSEG